MTGILTDALIEALARQSTALWAFGCIGFVMTPPISRGWPSGAGQSRQSRQPRTALHRRLLEHSEQDFTGGPGDRFL
ncbi:MAG: hypothetical protein ACJA07_000491 [Rhodococcus sp. (in: high G+C Gram-positive bacteria)]|jgi:hypothetical protein